MAATSEAAGTMRGEVRVVSLITAAHFMSHFYNLVIPPVMIGMVREYDLTFVELGLIVSAFSVASAVVQTPIGFLVDRYGARLPLIAGIALLSGTVAMYGVVTSFWALLAMAVIGGAANSVFHPADFSILAGSVHKSRLGRAFSIHGVAGNVGWAAVPLVMIFLSEIFGVRQSFIIVGVIGLVLAGLIWTQMGILKAETDEAKARGRAQKAREPGDKSAGWALLLSRPVMMLFAFQAIFSMSFGGVRQFAIAALAVLFGQPQAALGVALTGYMVGASCGNLIGGWLADRFDRPGLIFTFSIVSTTVLIAIIGAVPMPVPVLLAVMTLTGILQGMLQPSRDLLVRQVAPPGQMGKVFGFTSTGLAVGSAITPIVFGWVMDHGDPRWIFYISAAMMLCCLLTFAETARYLRRRSAVLAPAE